MLKLILKFHFHCIDHKQFLNYFESFLFIPNDNNDNRLFFVYRHDS